MRLLPASLVVGLLVVPPAGVRGDEARDVLERAIQAHGGEARLNRTKVGRIKAKVEGVVPGAGAFKGTSEEVFDLPRRYRRTMEEAGRGESSRSDYVVNGARGWMRQGKGPPQEFPVPEPPPIETYWQTFLAQLLMLRGPDARLSALPEERRGGRTFVGVRAVSPRVEVDLFFDRATGLLALARRAASLPGGLTVGGESTYEDYKDVGGVRFPMHVRVTNGMGQTLDIVPTSVEFLDRIDAAEFAKPETPRPAEDESATGRPPTGADEGSSGAEGPATERPPRWDVRLIVGTVGAGAVVGAVWLFVRYSRGRREPPAP